MQNAGWTAFLWGKSTLNLRSRWTTYKHIL